MLLSEMLRGVEVLSKFEDRELLEVTASTSKSLKSALFVCIEGLHYDGHDFAKVAVERGALAVVAQKKTGAENEVIVPDTREAYAVICANFFSNPAKKLKLLAVTGTNGKTSVATISKRLLDDCDMQSGLISTINASYGEHIDEMSATTPEPYVLNSLLQNMAKNGMKAVCMEASSHALVQKRLYGMWYNIAVFTNLTQDHLDYHKSMLEYYEAKRKLFDMAEMAVINCDDRYGQQLLKDLTIPCVTFSIENENADFYAKSIMCDGEGVNFTLCHSDCQYNLSFAIPGIYSVKNAIAAIAACSCLGISVTELCEALPKQSGIKGRSEVIKTNKGFNVICDYAHTPDGLFNLLKSVRQYAGGRITLLFGCGGDRDSEKRPQMGRIAAELADYTIITSDNPRTEQPGRIISDILKGIPQGSNYIAIVDRREAIRYAICTARKGDTVILAGKGHELYQVFGDKKIYFDERRLVEGIVKGMK